jgi:hypothetical protein
VAKFCSSRIWFSFVDEEAPQVEKTTLSKHCAGTEGMFGLCQTSSCYCHRHAFADDAGPRKRRCGEGSAGAVGWLDRYVVVGSGFVFWDCNQA